MPSIDIDIRKKLFKQIKVGGPDDCWIWLGAVNGKNYGHMSVDGEFVYVHRLIYNLYHGELDGHYVNHKCGISNCVNPHHLYKGDASDNTQDMWDRGRRSREEWRGENHPTAKLTNQQADEIKNRVEGDETYKEIAEDYPVTMSTVGSIANGEMWTYEDSE